MNIFIVLSGTLIAIATIGIGFDNGFINGLSFPRCGGITNAYCNGYCTVCNGFNLAELSATTTVTTQIETEYHFKGVISQSTTQNDLEYAPTNGILPATKNSGIGCVYADVDNTQNTVSNEINENNILITEIEILLNENGTIFGIVKNEEENRDVLHT